MIVTESVKSSSTKATATKPSIPVLDLAAQYRELRDEILGALTDVADGGAYVLGPHVAEFEREFAAYVGTRHCIGVNSGTSALHLALICAGVGPGDEVITVPMTFIATSWAITYTGAVPVFVDVDPQTCLMDAAEVERRITPRTKAILPVHLYGQPVDLDPLLEIGKKHGIPVIEDSAQAHGAAYKGQGSGTLGLSGCFSFYPGKNLGATGEAGAVVTDDDAIAKRLRALRDHAQSQRYYHDEIGFNYRMDAFQGATLRIKLRYLEQWIEGRRRLADRYLAHLADLPIQLPVEAVDRRHTWHLFVFRHPQRDWLRDELNSRGINTGLHYPVPVHLQKAYSHLGYKEGDFPNSEQVGQQCITLPLYPEMTESQQDRVIDALHDILGEGGTK